MFELSRVVVNDDPTGDGTRVYIKLKLDEPNVFAPLVPFGCDGHEPDFEALRGAVLNPDAVRCAGRRLFDAVAVHGDFVKELGKALDMQLPDRCPLFVKIGDPTGVESLPWEALCSPGGDFLGLDARWAVGRIIAGRGQSATLWPFTPPLRVAAVLSCLGIPAAPEWEALLEGLTASDLPVEILAVVSEEQLYEDIRAAAGAAPDSRVTVEFVPGGLTELQERVADFQPHVLHFFCHGSTEDGPHIELAAKSDWPYGPSSLTAEPPELRAFTAPTDQPWLVVLNCCESALAGVADDLHSLALNLVYAGIPAVVGMREPVFSVDANRFTRAFYKKMAHELATIGTASGEHVVDWTSFIVAARRYVAEKHKENGRTFSAVAASTKEWTLPSLYVGSQPFVLQCRPAAAAPPISKAEQLTLGLFEGLLARLPPATPPDMLAEIEAQIDRLRGPGGP